MPDHYPKGIDPQVMSHLAASLDAFLTEQHGEKLGFALLVFDFGDGPVGDASPTRHRSAYVSNAQRADMIRALREQAAALEMKLDTPPGGQAPGLN